MECMKPQETRHNNFYLIARALLERTSVWFTFQRWTKKIIKLEEKPRWIGIKTEICFACVILVVHFRRVRVIFVYLTTAKPTNNKLDFTARMKSFARTQRQDHIEHFSEVNLLVILLAPAVFSFTKRAQTVFFLFNVAKVLLVRDNTQPMSATLSAWNFFLAGIKSGV